MGARSGWIGSKKKNKGGLFILLIQNSRNLGIRYACLFLILIFYPIGKFLFSKCWHHPRALNDYSISVKICRKTSRLWLVRMFHLKEFCKCQVTWVNILHNLSLVNPTIKIRNILFYSISVRWCVSLVLRHVVSVATISPT